MSQFFSIGRQRDDIRPHVGYKTAIVLTVTLLQSFAVAQKVNYQPIKIFQPKRFAAAPIPAARTPLGIPEDYKPWIAQNPMTGELLVVAFHAGRNPFEEYAVFWRSTDGGKTWGKREERKDVPGREFAATWLSDGSIIMTCHFLAQDSKNKDKYTYSKVFRSTDGGKKWSEQRVGPEGFPEKGNTNTDRNAVEIPGADGKLQTYLGVSLAGARKESADHVFFWRSDNFGEAWDKSLKPDTGRWDDYDGFFGQSATHRLNNGKLIHVVRVDRRGKYWKLLQGELKKEAGDQGDRMMMWSSSDNGVTWKRTKSNGVFGTYGEMYPRFLNLKNGRVLLTFTVRSNSTDNHALGMRAVISENGETWDLRHDRLVIDYNNQGPSGGGYGNTIQNKDGSLVSVYSYRGRDKKTHVEAIRWRLPKRN